MTARHVTLGGGTRLAVAVAALGIAALLYTIKTDLGAIGAALASHVNPGNITIAYHQANMTTLTQCLCSPTRGVIKVITTCREDETIADCDARHLRTIAAWKTQVPDAVECDCQD